MIRDAVEIHLMNQDKLKRLLNDELLYMLSDINGMFIKIPYSNIMLHSAIHNENVWTDSENVGANDETN